MFVKGFIFTILRHCNAIWPIHHLFPVSHRPVIEHLISFIHFFSFQNKEKKDVIFHRVDLTKTIRIGVDKKRKMINYVYVSFFFFRFERPEENQNRITNQTNDHFIYSQFICVFFCSLILMFRIKFD